MKRKQSTTCLQQVRRMLACERAQQRDVAHAVQRVCAYAACRENAFRKFAVTKKLPSIKTKSFGACVCSQYVSATFSGDAQARCKRMNLFVSKACFSPFTVISLLQCSRHKTVVADVESHVAAPGLSSMWCYYQQYVLYLPWGILNKIPFGTAFVQSHFFPFLLFHLRVPFAVKLKLTYVALERRRVWVRRCFERNFDEKQNKRKHHTS